MPRLVLVDTRARSNTRLDPTSGTGHRASATEGEAAKKLLESQGFVLKRTANGQHEFPCPFHEGPGAIPARKGTNFYVDAQSSKYSCHSASCGERGNLQTLERFFGIDEPDDSWINRIRSKDQLLKEYEANLTTVLRKPFYEHGLTDETIERFRLGYQPAHTNEAGTRISGRYVIPYLDGRRPKFFRYYAPDGDPKFKYTWEEGAQATLFNAQDAVGDHEGKVFLCEGEQKAMLLVQMGYAAVAVAGASQWKDEYQAAFTHARQVIIVYDNDNPAFHVYESCPKCRGKGLDACLGHNPGQEAALQRLEQIGWRARNVLLPLPDDETRKTDINDFFMRDGHNNAEFFEMSTGKRVGTFKVLSFAEIAANPPEQTEFLVEQGILPKAGRLLCAGKPKVGKSIFIDNLALSLAAGIPFLGRFKVDHPTRTLLLDRELSKWSLFSRLKALMDARPGYRAAEENLLIDHDHLVRLDQRGAAEVLQQLVEQNGAEVLILDTAYKFFGGDVESSSSLMKGFEALDKVMHETGVSVILTHHLRKGQGGKGKENTDVADPDAVVGSFLWTGWPNATILLNYLNRSVENPFNAVCTFTAFRDAAAPEPLALYRSRDSIAYSAIQDYSHEDAAGVPERAHVVVTKPTTESVQELLLEMTPTTEDDFLHVAAAHFGVSIGTLKPYYLDAMASGHFERTSSKPPIIKYRYSLPEPQSWESDHGLPERQMPGQSGFEDVSLFDAAGLS